MPDTRPGNHLLTIWIPTFRRPRQLTQLLSNIAETRITELAHIVISDNDPEEIKIAIDKFSEIIGSYILEDL